MLFNQQYDEKIFDVRIERKHCQLLKELMYSGKATVDDVDREQFVSMLDIFEIENVTGNNICKPILQNF